MSYSRIMERTASFRDTAVWPRQQDFNVERWLSNFENDDLDIAGRLLLAFCYFNKHATDALLRQAVQNYMSTLWDSSRYPTPPSKLPLTEIAFVICEGETPHVTDSGNLFARKLRDDLAVPEWAIMDPRTAISNYLQVKHFIFVDDFAGSGNQFIDTIKRPHSIAGTAVSFESLLRMPLYQIAYCPCVATSHAFISRIPAQLNHIHLHPAHLIDPNCSVVNPASRIWQDLPEPEAQRQIQKIKMISARAGYTAENGGQDDWRGFHALGLTIAFEHGIPDASLPLFYSVRHGWKPLMRRAE